MYLYILKMLIKKLISKKNQEPIKLTCLSKTINKVP